MASPKDMRPELPEWRQNKKDLTPLLKGVVADVGQNYVASYDVEMQDPPEEIEGGDGNGWAAFKEGEDRYYTINLHLKKKSKPRPKAKPKPRKRGAKK